jgi:hypothetical protein
MSAETKQPTNAGSAAGKVPEGSSGPGKVPEGASALRSGRAHPIQRDRTGTMEPKIKDMELIDIKKADELATFGSEQKRQLEALQGQISPEARLYAKQVMAGIQTQFELDPTQHELEFPWPKTLGAPTIVHKSCCGRAVVDSKDMAHIRSVLASVNIHQEYQRFLSCRQNRDHYSCWYKCMRTFFYPSDSECRNYGCRPTHIVWKFYPEPEYEDVMGTA